MKKTLLTGIITGALLLSSTGMAQAAVFDYAYGDGINEAWVDAYTYSDGIDITYESHDSTNNLTEFTITASTASPEGGFAEANMSGFSSKDEASWFVQASGSYMLDTTSANLNFTGNVTAEAYVYYDYYMPFSVYSSFGNTEGSINVTIEANQMRAYDFYSELGMLGFGIWNNTTAEEVYFFDGYDGSSGLTTISLSYGNSYELYFYADLMGMSSTEYQNGEIVFSDYGDWSEFDGGIFLTMAEEEPLATPVPGAIWLLGSGLIGLVGFRRKRQA